MVKIGRLKRTDVIRRGKGKVRTEREEISWERQRRWIDRICEGTGMIRSGTEENCGVQAEE